MSFRFLRHRVWLFLAYAAVAIFFTAHCTGQVTDPPSSVLGDLKEEIQSSLSKQLPQVFKISILKKYEASVLELRGQLAQEVDGREKFGRELLNISERYFSLAAFSEADRLNSEIAQEFQNDTIGAVANARLGYSSETIGENRAAANEFYEKAVKHFRSVDLKNDLTAAYAAMSTMNNAADNYMLQRQDAEAEDLYRFLLDSAELSEVALPDVRLNAANELAALLRKKGEWEEAAERFREATSFVANSTQPEDFKDKLLMSLWESEMDAKFRSSSTKEAGTNRFKLDTLGLEEIWLGLKGKRKGVGVRVGSALLLCYRFGDAADEDREKIPELADDVIDIIGEKPNHEDKGYLYAMQARLLRIEELKRQRSPKFRKELQDYIAEWERAKSPEFVPIVGSRFPDHESVKKRLHEIHAESVQPTPAKRSPREKGG